MPEQLNLRVGDSFPTMPFRCRLPAGVSAPSLAGASFAMRAWPLGGGDVVELLGSVTLAVNDAGDAIDGEYIPSEAEGLVVARYWAECSVDLADGRRFTLPFSENGVSRFFRINVTEILESTEPTPVEDEEAVGIWAGQYPGVYP